MEPKIEITIKEYENLKRSASMLQALEASGVDNWEWYSEALSSFFEDEETEEDIYGC